MTNNQQSINGSAAAYLNLAERIEQTPRRGWRYEEFDVLHIVYVTHDRANTEIPLIPGER